MLNEQVVTVFLNSYPLSYILIAVRTYFCMKNKKIQKEKCFYSTFEIKKSIKNNKKCTKNHKIINCKIMLFKKKKIKV